MCCPHFQRDMHKHDYYHRMVAMKRRAFKIPIYRWFCPACKKTLSLLPDFLILRARHATIVREATVQRRMKGQSFSQIVESITSRAVMVSRCTVKRWYKRHLSQAEKASLWIAKKLIEAGVEKDLLRQYKPGVNHTLEDTAQWLRKLLSLYAPEYSLLRGYWQLVNKELPTNHLL